MHNSCMYDIYFVLFFVIFLLFTSKVGHDAASLCFGAYFSHRSQAHS